MADEQLVVQLEARIREFERSFERANRVASKNWTDIENRGNRAARNIENSFALTGAKIGGSIKSVAGSLAGAFAGGFAIGGLSQLPQLIRSTVASAAEIADVADRIGLTTERLQELRFAADQSGVETGELDAAMEQFSRRIGEAAAGGGDLLRVLQANGIVLRNTDGSMRPLNALLADFANLIQNATTEQDRLALATDAFGRGGTGMVNVLAEGASGLDAMAGKARDLGAVLSEDLVRSAADVDDKFAELQARFTVFMQSSIIEFVGDVQTVMADLAGAADTAANAWANFEGVYNRVFRITPEDAAKSKLRAALIRGAVTGDYGVDDSDLGITFAQAPKGNRPGMVTKPTIVPPARTVSTGGSGGAGAGSRRSAVDDAERQRKAVDELIDALEHERSIIGASETEARLANELRRAGAAATTEQKAKITALVPAIEAEKAARDRAAQSAENMRDLGREGLGGILSDLKAGTSLANTFTNAIERLTDRLLDMALDSLFAAPTGSGPGSISAFLPKLLGFSKGGAVRGPGTGTSDSVPARLSNGEFVIRATEAAKHRPLLEKINAGHASTGMPETDPSSPETTPAPASRHKAVSEHSTARSSVSEHSNSSDLHSERLTVRLRELTTIREQMIRAREEQRSKGPDPLNATARPPIAHESPVKADPITIVQRMVLAAVERRRDNPHASRPNRTQIRPRNPAFAEGGMVRGPGTSRSDSIPARLSNGEFVVNAAATGKHRAVLEAINSGRIRAFADGGLVGTPALGTRAIGATTANFAPTINVHVEGGSRGPKADAELADSIGKQVEASVRGLVVSEMLTQMRPGGVLTR